MKSLKLCIYIFLVLSCLAPILTRAQVSESMRQNLAEMKSNSHRLSLDKKREVLTEFENKAAELGTVLAEASAKQIELLKFMQEYIASVGLPESETDEVMSKLKAMANWYIEGEKISKLLQPVDTIRASAQSDNEEGLITEFSGNGSLKTRPFTVGGPWEIQWDLEGNGILTITLHDENGGFGDVVAMQMEEGRSSSYQPKEGTYYLDIQGMGNWEVKIVRVRD